MAAGLRCCCHNINREEQERWEGKKHSWNDVSLSPGNNPLSAITGELFDIRGEFRTGDAAEFGFTLRGIPVTYNVQRQELTCLENTAPLEPIDGKIRLHILLDRASIEIFGNDGRIALPIGVIPEDENKTLEIFSKGGSTEIVTLDVYELRSIWV